MKSYLITLLIVMPIAAGPPGSASMTDDENRQRLKSRYSNQHPYHYEGEEEERENNRGEIGECCLCCCQLTCVLLGAVFSAIKKDVVDVFNQDRG